MNKLLKDYKPTAQFAKESAQDLLRAFGKKNVKVNAIKLCMLTEVLFDDRKKKKRRIKH